ncbi:MAG: hypothetical protein M3Y82_14450 [Verrucomicrobiota bacterium]|nr:hypothetical protein [Verrucomicrobiota bacterium]
MNQLSVSSPKKLWSCDSEFDAVWKKRIAIMASYLELPGAVADFGCGLMWLEQFLPPQNSYLPIDYIQRDTRTFVLDFNRDSLENIKAEVAVLSGVLEYIQDAGEFIRKLKDRNFKRIILSYCTLEKHGNMEARKALNWVSHESIFRLLALFLDHYYLAAINDVNNNTILVFDRKSHENLSV